MTKLRNSTEATSNTTGKRLGCFEITKVVREFVDLNESRDDCLITFGCLLDEQLNRLADEHAECQSVKLHISEEAWPQVMEFYSTSRGNRL